ncbi:hypothetical protein Baya_13299 [Bagarius yarrelli]|uniref:Uncharacterized protein n=1 Tax=Bagarius yarrelli TaxID=175774 RepID=A0A556V5X9_BAGYA|nr:hypothetical protein Baya_13299 [Bagarius yarrelli]
MIPRTREKHSALHSLYIALEKRINSTENEPSNLRRKKKMEREMEMKGGRKSLPVSLSDRRRGIGVEMEEKPGCPSATSAYPDISHKAKHELTVWSVERLAISPRCMSTLPCRRTGRDVSYRRTTG